MGNIDVKIEKLNLLNENEKYYLDVAILVETEDFINRCKSKLILPINKRNFSIVSSSAYGRGESFFNLGFGELQCVDNNYEIEVIKEKPHEMTISDIEKQLGYKIKIVSEGAENT